jgi:uncharacterized damage-inducible protein DinB
VAATHTRVVNAGAGSARAAVLAGQLGAAAAALIELVQGLDSDCWRHVPGPGVWSIGKETEHVVEGMARHQWIVRLTVGHNVTSRRPAALERDQLTTELAPHEMAALLRERADEGAQLVASLADEELALPTRPPRAKEQSLAETIERVMIGHVRTHHREIESKVRVSR